ncbi:glycine-rich protein [Segatella albensis]|uniref:glycine-rich protein n=1 Tax=Segatella albensis TaxID=77768 RepID=UPI0003F8F2A4|nr:glycine-rich protein [Segatella albensis]
MQTFIAPISGDYKLEVWGAQGGISYGGIPGKGGYSCGSLSVTSGHELYICIGQCTGSITADYTGISAYNGGGTGASAGGGATHIASTDRGELKNYELYKTEVYIVAGGGGAGADGDFGTGIGGAGGGATGENGPYWEGLIRRATGGSQTEPGVNGGNGQIIEVNIPGFGQGGGAYRPENNYNNYGGGGGGGWYGGGGYAYAGSGAGGSGHIGEMLTNGSMQSGVREGHGYAVITWMPIL